MADKSVLKPAQRREGPGRSAFASLAIWRTKVADDLESVPSSDGFKLRLLADQTKELEMAGEGPPLRGAAAAAALAQYSAHQGFFTHNLPLLKAGH